MEQKVVAVTKQEQQKQESLQKAVEVDKLISEGMGKRAACDKVGIGYSTFWSIKRNDDPAKLKNAKKLLKPKSSYAALPMRSSGFELRGSPEEIARFVKELAKGVHAHE